jgi:hypothetical protein
LIGAFGVGKHQPYHHGETMDIDNENKTIIHFISDINTLLDISRNNQTDKSNSSMKFVLYLE